MYAGWEENALKLYFLKKKKTGSGHITCHKYFNVIAAREAPELFLPIPGNMSFGVSSYLPPNIKASIAAQDIVWLKLHIGVCPHLFFPYPCCIYCIPAAATAPVGPGWQFWCLTNMVNCHVDKQRESFSHNTSSIASAAVLATSKSLFCIAHCNV